MTETRCVAAMHTLLTCRILAWLLLRASGENVEQFTDQSLVSFWLEDSESHLSLLQTSFEAFRNTLPTKKHDYGPPATEDDIVAAQFARWGDQFARWDDSGPYDLPTNSWSSQPLRKEARAPDGEMAASAFAQRTQEVPLSKNNGHQQEAHASDAEKYDHSWSNQPLRKEAPASVWDGESFASAFAQRAQELPLSKNNGHQQEAHASDAEKYDHSWSSQSPQKQARASVWDGESLASAFAQRGQGLHGLKNNQQVVVVVERAHPSNETEDQTKFTFDIKRAPFSWIWFVVAGVGAVLLFCIWVFTCGGGMAELAGDAQEVIDDLEVFGYICCNTRPEMWLMNFFILLFIVGGFWLLWATHIIQPILKDLAAYGFLLLVVILVCSIVYYEMKAHVMDSIKPAIQEAMDLKEQFMHVYEATAGAARAAAAAAEEAERAAKKGCFSGLDCIFDKLEDLTGQEMPDFEDPDETPEMKAEREKKEKEEKLARQKKKGCC